MTAGDSEGLAQGITEIGGAKHEVPPTIPGWPPRAIRTHQDEPLSDFVQSKCQLGRGITGPQRIAVVWQKAGKQPVIARYASILGDCSISVDQVTFGSCSRYGGNYWPRSSRVSSYASAEANWTASHSREPFTIRPDCNQAQLPQLVERPDNGDFFNRTSGFGEEMLQPINGCARSCLANQAFHDIGKGFHDQRRSWIRGGFDNHSKCILSQTHQSSDLWHTSVVKCDPWASRRVFKVLSDVSGGTWPGENETRGEALGRRPFSRSLPADGLNIR